MASAAACALVGALFVVGLPSAGAIRAFDESVMESLASSLQPRQSQEASALAEISSNSSNFPFFNPTELLNPIDGFVNLVLPQTKIRTAKKMINCELSRSNEVIECGKPTEPGKLYAEMAFAAKDAAEACTMIPIALPPCISSGESIWRRKVWLPGQSLERWCCLCPKGKKFDLKKGWCVTRDLEKHKLPCSKVPGACRDPNGVLDLAGSTPEAACRSRFLFVSGCWATNMRADRTQVDLPGIFPGQREAYCCICPENSIYSSAERACICRGNAGHNGRLFPTNRICPSDQDQALSSSVQGSTEAQLVAPAMQQIEMVRSMCMKHRYADEILDPERYGQMVYRDGILNKKGWAIAVQSIKVMKLDTTLKLTEEASGVAIEFVPTLDLEIGIGTIHLVMEGQTFDLTAPSGGFSLEVGVRATGKEYLSRLVEFGTSGHLSFQMNHLQVNVMQLPISVDFLKKIVEQQVLGKVIGGIFANIGHTARQVSVQGPLDSLTDDSKIYPMELQTWVTAGDCPIHQLCLGLKLRMGQKMGFTKYGATLQDITLDVNIRDSKFSSTITGNAGLNMGATLHQVFGEQSQQKIDLAFGDSVVEKNEEGAEDADEAKRKEALAAEKERKKAELMKEEVCKARIGEWNVRQAVATGVASGAMKVVQVGGFFGRLVMNTAGNAYSLYSGGSEEPQLKVPATPGLERGNFEAGLFAAWQELFPQQKGILSRSQEAGKEPTFAVVSATTALLAGAGSFRVVKKGITISLEGELSLAEAQVLGLRYDTCQPDDHYKTAAEFSACWKPSAINGKDVGVAPTVVKIHAQVREDGEITACAAVNDISITTGFGGLADSAVSVLAYGVNAKAFIQDFIEAKLGEVLYEALIVKQQGKLDGASIDVSITPSGVNLAVGLNAQWKDIGRLTAKLGSQPPPLTGETELGGVGSAWEALWAKADKEASPRTRDILRSAVPSLSRDPRVWLAPGMLKVPSELVTDLTLKGNVDFTGAQARPVELSGRMKINLGKLLWSDINDHGGKDFGHYATTAGIVQVSVGNGKATEMEALVDCGYLFLSEPDSGANAYRVTLEGHHGSMRVMHELDLTKSVAMARRDGAPSFVDPTPGICGGGLSGFKGITVGSFQVRICVKTGSAVEVVISAEVARRALMRKMILEEDFRNSMLWSPLKVFWRTGPFDWEEGARGHGELVQESCEDEVKRCEMALKCMGVQLLLGECNFLSVYDLADGVQGYFQYKRYKVGTPDSWGGMRTSI